MDLESLVTVAGKKPVQIINCLITFCKFIINIISTIFVLPVNTIFLPSQIQMINVETVAQSPRHIHIDRCDLFI